MVNNVKFNILNQLPIVDTTNRHVYIWGTGNTSIGYQEAFLREDWLDIYGYAVNDTNQVGKIFSGKRIFSADEVAADKDALVFICTLQPTVYNQVSEQMRRLGVEAYLIDAVIFGKNREKIESVIGMLEDEESVETYLHILECRAKGLYPDSCYINDHLYTALPEFRFLNQNDIFVDCGAFVGDTIEKFIWDHYGIFKKIIAIEPNPRNFKAMSIRVKRLKEEWALDDEAIELYPYGVGEASKVASVEESNSGNICTVIANRETIQEDDNSVQIVALDDFIKTEYTFLKADIESWEYKMLLGARKGIKKWHPRLGICIYHNATDFYSIPLLIKEICPDYRLAVRNHTAQVYDTVLYAW